MCVRLCVVRSLLLFFKQKTAYDMRISDWSSDVCSSDLLIGRLPIGAHFPGDEIRRGIIGLRPEAGGREGVADCQRLFLVAVPCAPRQGHRWRQLEIDLSETGCRGGFLSIFVLGPDRPERQERKSTRLNSSH